VTSQGDQEPPFWPAVRRPAWPGRARTGRSACGRARVPHGC